jgi:hypothetical protein
VNVGRGKRLVRKRGADEIMELRRGKKIKSNVVAVAKADEEGEKGKDENTGGEKIFKFMELPGGKRTALWPYKHWGSIR